VRHQNPAQPAVKNRPKTATTETKRGQLAIGVAVKPKTWTTSTLLLAAAVASAAVSVGVTVQTDCVCRRMTTFSHETMNSHATADDGTVVTLERELTQPGRTTHGVNVKASRTDTQTLTLCRKYTHSDVSDAAAAADIDPLDVD